MRRSAKAFILVVSTAAVCGFVYAQGQAPAAGTPGGTAGGVAGGQASGAAVGGAAVAAPAAVAAATAAIAAAAARSANASANSHPPTAHEKGKACQPAGRRKGFGKFC